jgi:type VI secretion system Hcp family effector
VSRVVVLSALLALLVVLGAGSPGPATSGAADYYLKIDGIDGEATDGSIGLTGFAWDTRADVGRFAEYTAPREAASGMASGRRMHKPLTIVKEVDKASPKLMEACAKGTHIGDVEVWSREGGQAALRYTLQDAIISSYSISGPSESSPRPVESVSFSFAQVRLGPADPGAATNLNSSRSN